MADDNEIKLSADSSNVESNEVVVSSEDYVLSDSEKAQLLEDARLEKKYGGKPIQTAIESGLGAATFGATTYLQSLQEGPETLRKRREYNPEAEMVGEIAGTVLPTIASGGTSLLAKGATKAGAGILAAEKAGKLTEKAISKLVQQAGKKKLARSVLEKAVSKGAGLGVEGAIIGTGELIEESVLGNQEFNAQNLAAFSGTGALLGGAAGGFFGTAEAIVPVFNKLGKIKDVKVKKVDPTQANKSAAEFAGYTPAGIINLEKKHKMAHDNLANHFVNNLDLKVLKSPEAMFKKNVEFIEQSGKKLGDAIEKTDNLVDDTTKFSRREIALAVDDKLAKLEEEFSNIKTTSAQNKARQIKESRALWDEWKIDDSIVTGKELNKMKGQFQNLARYDKDPMKLTIDQEINRNLSSVMREKVFELADRVSTTDNNLGAELRKLNLDYHTAATISDTFEKKVAREGNLNKLLGLKDQIYGAIGLSLGDVPALITGGLIGAKRYAESDLKRKIDILSSIEGANKKVESKISNSIKNFFEKPRKLAAPTSTKVLLKTSFAMDKKERKTSKSRKEGYKRIKKELTDIQQNPERMVERLAKNGLRITKAAPNTAMALEQTIVRGVQFLTDKLPKSKVDQGMIQTLRKSKEYMPSTLELAKFERYVEAVENPMSVLDDLESGRVSREKIEAVREVYPDLYKRIQTQTMELITKNADTIGYQKRLQLGVLLDIPADTSLVPKNMLRLQESFAQQPEQQEAATQGAVSTTQGGLENIDFASDAQTDAQRTATRK